MYINPMKDIVYSVQLQIICTYIMFFFYYYLFTHIAIHTYIIDKIKINKLISINRLFFSFLHKAAVWKTVFQEFSDADKVLHNPWSITFVALKAMGTAPVSHICVKETQN